MKLAALLLFFAIVGKIGAGPVPLRIAYYRGDPEQNLQDELDEAEEETDISNEDFSNDAIQDEIGDIQDDDDDSEEQEPPPPFSKLFPLPQRTSPGYHFPLASMMSSVSQQGWNVPKAPQGQRQRQRGRTQLELARDDDDDDSDEEEDEEEDDEIGSEDDLPDWNRLFPSQDQLDGPPQNQAIVSPGSAAAFRSAIGGGSRLVYVPARQLRRIQQQQIPTRQYVMRNPMPQRRQQVVYTMASLPQRRQPMYQSRPQYAMISNIQQRRPAGVYYLPVRRNNYSPYVNRYVPRYRYY